MKFSIVTATKNEKEKLRTTLKSLIRQTLKDFEWIVIDSSQDFDQSLVSEAESNQIKIIYIYKDLKIYEAFNEALKVADSEVISFLNSGEIYLDRALEKIYSVFERNGSDFVVVDAIFHESGRFWLRKPLEWPFKKKPYQTMPLSHPSLFVKKKVFSEIGDFDLKYKYASDLEWFLRLIYQDRYLGSYLSEVLLILDEPNLTRKKIFSVKKEYRLIAEEYGKNPLLSRIHYYSQIMRSFFSQKISDTKKEKVLKLIKNFWSNKVLSEKELKDLIEKNSV